MEFWEFLLQKEGDRSWLPLEAPKVEILEGRYRVVARTSRADAPIEVRVTHLATQEDPPIRRVQKRTSKTNRDGLVVIIPFTRLLPGRWELRCLSDVMADMMGEGWQYAVQLQVASWETVPEDDWNPDWQESAADPEASDQAEPELALEESDPNIPSLTEAGVAADLLPLEHRIIAPAESSPLATPALAGEDTSSAEERPIAESSAIDPSPISEEARPPEISDADRPLAPINAGLSSTVDRPDLQLLLHQDAYIVQPNQPLVVAGQVSLDQEPADTATAGIVAASMAAALTELRVRLSDPQTVQVLVDEVRPFVAAQLPCSFACPVTLPQSYETYLLLGELILYGAIDGQSVELATQSFTVTTVLHELLEAVANNYGEADFPLPPEANTPEPAISTVFLNFPAASRVPLQVQPIGSPSLPPQLRPTDPAKPRKGLDLPSFASPTSPPSPAAASSPAAKSVASHQVNAIDAPDITESIRIEGAPPAPTASPADRPPLEEEGVAIEENHLESRTGSGTEAEPEQSPVEGSAQIEDPLESSEEQTALPSDSVLDRSPDALVAMSGDADSHWATDATEIPRWQQLLPKHPPPNSPEDAAFRSLNLQQRFWARLQSLATDRELADWLQDEPPEELLADSTTDRSAGRPLRRLGRRSIGMDADLAANEVVAEDELEATPRSEESPVAIAGSTPALGREDPSLASSLSFLPEEPIPVPQVNLPTTTLVAEQPIAIAVKLPYVLPRLYVKLWLRDRQTRLVVGEPHWLMDFLPDGFGNQTARTELRIPQGCLEIQVEAITVEMTTQRESDRTVQYCTVEPSNVSTLSPDELDS